MGTSVVVGALGGCGTGFPGHGKIGGFGEVVSPLPVGKHRDMSSNQMLNQATDLHYLIHHLSNTYLFL